MLVVVTGLMRTGTSLIAKQLHELGCSMGSVMRFPLMRENSQLDYEDVEFTDKCLAALNGTLTQARLRVFFNRYIRQRNQSGAGLWGVKSPFLYPYVDMFKAETKVPVKVIVTRRNIPDTFESIKRQTALYEPEQIQRYLISWPEPDADLVIPIEESWNSPELVKQKLIELVRS